MDFFKKLLRWAVFIPAAFIADIAATVLFRLSLSFTQGRFFGIVMDEDVSSLDKPVIFWLLGDDAFHATLFFLLGMGPSVASILCCLIPPKPKLALTILFPLLLVSLYFVREAKEPWTLYGHIAGLLLGALSVWNWKPVKKQN